MIQTFLLHCQSYKETRRSTHFVTKRKQHHLLRSRSNPEGHRHSMCLDMAAELPPETAKLAGPQTN